MGPQRTLLYGIAGMTIFLLCNRVLIPSLSTADHGRSFGIPSSRLSTFASNAFNNTVVVVPVNTGMLHLAKNLLCSLSVTPFDTSRIVFWALDEGAESALNHSHATYRDPSLFATSGNENRRGISNAYRRMMKERPRFFIDILSSGFDILMLDADTVFWQSPLSIVPTDKSDMDAVFSTDAREFYQIHDAFLDVRRRGSRMPPICNGIFWMKASERTVALWSEMLDRFEATGPVGWYRRRRFQDDQRGMDVLLNDGRARLVGPLPGGITPDMLAHRYQRPIKEELNVRLLDQTLVVNGYLLRNRRKTYEENLARIRARGEDRIAAHFNWNSKDATKEEGAAELKMYFTDGSGSCKLEH